MKRVMHTIHDNSHARNNVTTNEDLYGDSTQLNLDTVRPFYWVSHS